jgi:hypothetical protein
MFKPPLLLTTSIFSHALSVVVEGEVTLTKILEPATPMEGKPATSTIGVVADISHAPAGVPVFLTAVNPICVASDATSPIAPLRGVEYTIRDSTFFTFAVVIDEQLLDPILVVAVEAVVIEQVFSEVTQVTASGLTGVLLLPINTAISPKTHS